MLLAGCLGSAFKSGNAADPPVDVSVVPGDSSATVTWTASPNVQYWLFAAPASSVTPDNWNQLPGGRALINVTSPLLVTGLINGLNYSFTLNGRSDNGPGGSGSPSTSTVPRLSGGNWTIGSPLVNDLRGTAYGAVAGVAYLVTVGAHGALYSSPDFNAWTPLSWTQRTNPLATLPDLNAVTYGSSSALYIAVGAGGTILSSPDAVAWTVRNSTTTNALYGITLYGSGGFMAVGEKGTILITSDGTSWTSVNSGTTNDLFGVTFGNGIYVAVGANGTILSSANGTTWTAIPSNNSLDLHGIAYGVNPITLTPTYMAVGAAGTVMTSADGTAWTVRTRPTNSNLNSVTFTLTPLPNSILDPVTSEPITSNRQFVIVGDGGTVITSLDGSSMQLQNSGTSSNLATVAHNFYGLFAVGAAGTNLFSL
ncbi:MAG: hypothetical protein WC073_14370 [Sterolibacterium sp.]